MLIDETGNRHGRLLVLERAGTSKGGKALWSCQCDCGNVSVVWGDSLRSGNTRSCGCLQREKSTTHGLCGSAEYRTLKGMKDRCTNKHNPAYRHYGGRGIKVCDRWLSSLEDFYADMGPRPSPQHSIDRIDNDGDYTPENCRWATQTEQLRNTRVNHLLSHNGKTQCLVAWAEELDMHPTVLYSRITRLGWSTDRALTMPVKRAGVFDHYNCGADNDDQDEAD